MCTGRPMQEGGMYTTDADIQPPRNPTNTKQSVMTCPILKRPADCTRLGPSRLSFTPKPRPKQCVGELEIPGLPSTTRTLFSGLRVSTHGKQAGPLVGFYQSAGRQPANSTPRPAGGASNKSYLSNNALGSLGMITTPFPANFSLCQIGLSNVIHLVLLLPFGKRLLPSLLR